MKIDLPKLQEKVTKDLQTILKAPSMANAFQQPNFQTVVEKQLNVLAYLEKTNGSKETKVNELLQSYNQLSGKHFTIDQNISFIDHETLVDDVNYLGIYIRNIYKIDLAMLAAGKQANITSPTVSEAAPKSAGGATPFALPGMDNLPPGQNPMSVAMASARIHQEFLQGKIYIFKTKPKVIPLIKWIVGGLLFLFILAAIFVGIGMIASHNSIHASNFGVTDGLGALSAMPYFCLAAFAIFGCYRTIGPMIKAPANPNQIYAFNINVYAVTGMLFLMLLIFGGALGVDLSIFNQAMLPWKSPIEPSSLCAFGLWSWFIGYLFLIIAAGCLIGVVIFGSFKAPKVDTDRINNLTRQYAEEASRIPPTPPPGAS